MGNKLGDKLQDKLGGKLGNKPGNKGDKASRRRPQYQAKANKKGDHGRQVVQAFFFGMFRIGRCVANGLEKDAMHALRQCEAKRVGCMFASQPLCSLDWGTLQQTE